MKNHIIYNPHSCCGKGEEAAKALAVKLGDDIRMTDITTITDYKDFMASCAGEKVILCGGDGTINRFVNEIDGIELDCELFYSASGTGNDFLKEVAKGDTDALINLKDYIKDLPVCTVKGKSYRFLNAIGFGIDGYCCEEGDHQRAKGKTNINYTAIAIKGLLFKYKPTGATITVDGVKHTFKKVWIAPVMKGKYYGGGMMPAPDQDRNDPEGKVSLFVFHDSGKLKTLKIFPNIFKGTHVSHTDVTKVFCGHEITVEFDGPRALQIDGETVLDVTSYSVSAKKTANII